MKSSEKIIADLSVLGKAIKYLSGIEKDAPKEFTASELQEVEELIERVHIHNGWFTPEMVRKALEGIALMLEKGELESWVASYPIQQGKPKTIAIIMASNIPLVGFHDFLSVLISGNKPLVKMSSEDNKLLPAILKLFYQLDENYKNWVLQINPNAYRENEKEI